MTRGTSSSLRVANFTDQPGFHADRLFWSILDTWNSVTNLSADVKELIPEFYSTDPAFLLNLEKINFGTRAAGTVPLTRFPTFPPRESHVMAISFLASWL